MTRTYDMSRRQKSAEATRTRIVDAAHGLLNDPAGGLLSIQDVADAAGVSRATIYNSIGSRRDLLMAVFEDQGRIIDFDRVIAAMSLDDEAEALLATVRESCRAWGVVPVAIRRTLALSVVDSEVSELVTRYERHRRAMLAGVVKRAKRAGALGSTVGIPQATATLAILSGFPAYDQLRLELDASSVTRRLVKMATTALGLRGVA